MLDSALLMATSCVRIFLKAWACQHTYADHHIPNLRITFVRQCTHDFATDALHHEAHGEFTGAQCKELQNLKLNLPWLCPSCHDLYFDHAGRLTQIADALQSSLEDPTIAIKLTGVEEDAPLPQVRLLN
jgi:hypothetical protein